MKSPRLAVIASTLLAAASGAMASSDAQAIDSFIKPPPALTADLPGVRTLQFDSKLAGELKQVAARDGRLKLTALPMPGGDVLDLDLVTTNPFTDGFRFEWAPGLGSKDRESTFIDPLDGDLVFLKGTVPGDPDSMVIIATEGERVEGLVKTGERTAIITSDPGAPDRPVVIYEPSALPEGLIESPAWHCETNHGEIVRQLPEMPSGGVAGTTASCYRLKLALDLDYELVADQLGSDAWAVLTYVGMLVTAADEICRRDLGLGVVMSYGRGWYEPADPWDQGTTQSQLNQFRDYWNANMVGVDRDVASLLSARFLGGGRASGIGTLCNVANSYNVCGSLNTLFPYPVEDHHPQNWSLFVFLHELGHNLGASHTHTYTPPLDDCATDCTSAPNGTVMSYCHLCPGGDANLNFRFHPVTSLDIQSHLAASSCITEVSPFVDITDDTELCYINTPKEIDVLANDYSSCDLPTVLDHDTVSARGGTVSLRTDAGPHDRHTLRYTPPTGFTGIDTFSYIGANLYGDFGTALVTVNVIGQPEVISEYLVLDESDNSIRRIDATSHELLGYFLPGFNNALQDPQSIATHPGGDILVGDDFLGQVHRFNGATGEYRGVFYDHPDLLSCEAIHVYDGRVYMLDRFGGWIFSCDLNGNNDVNLFQGFGTGRDLTISNTGVLYVSGDIDGNEITAIDRHSGDVRHTITNVNEIGQPGGIAFADGKLMVGDAETGEVVRINAWGNGSTITWTVSSNQAYAYDMSGVREFAEGPEYGSFFGRIAAVSSTACLDVQEINGFTSMGRSEYREEFDSPLAITYREGFPILPVDLNFDNAVNGADLGLLLGSFGSQGPTGDINNDGIVNGADMGLLLAAWTGG